MRYFIQFMIMLADVIFLFMMGLGMYSVILEPVNVYTGLLMVVLICVAVIQWDKMGGFMAWKPSEIKRFMKNAKRMGL